jgi:hypothetical protein
LGKCALAYAILNTYTEQPGVGGLPPGRACFPFPFTRNKDNVLKNKNIGKYYFQNNALEIWVTT